MIIYGLVVGTLLAALIIAFIKARKRSRLMYVVDHHPEELEFNFIAGIIVPDVIEVWHNGERLKVYYWIEGEDAFYASELGKLHAVFKEWNDAQCRRADNR